MRVGASSYRAQTTRPQISTKCQKGAQAPGTMASPFTAHQEHTMSLQPLQSIWDTYTASWKTDSAADREALFSQSLDPACTYNDPLATAQGWGRGPIDHPAPPLSPAGPRRPFWPPPPPQPKPAKHPQVEHGGWQRPS